MQQVYLTRRNLLTLLSKLDRAKAGETTERTIVKTDVVHPVYPCSDTLRITALEDAEYYTDRTPGPMAEADEARISLGREVLV
jgi:hypothetical protein